MQPEVDHTAQRRAREWGDAPAGRSGPTHGHISLREDTQEPDCGHIPMPDLNLVLSLIKLKYCYNLHLYDSSQLTWNLGDKKEMLCYSTSPIQMLKLIIKL